MSCRRPASAGVQVPGRMYGVGSVGVGGSRHDLRVHQDGAVSLLKNTTSLIARRIILKTRGM